MIADSMKPISGVAVVRLAPMHDAVNESAVRSLDALGNRMRLIKMIMPKIHDRANELLGDSRQASLTKDRFKAAIQFGKSRNTDSRAGAKFRHCGSRRQLQKF